MHVYITACLLPPFLAEIQLILNLPLLQGNSSSKASPTISFTIHARSLARDFSTPRTAGLIVARVLSPFSLGLDTGVAKVHLVRILLHTDTHRAKEGKNTRRR